MKETELESSHDLDKVPLNLKGALRSFLDTGLAPLIEQSLLEAGINPATYDLETAGHENYYGLPVTEAQGYGSEVAVLSPIMIAIGERMEGGEIVIDHSNRGKVRLKSTEAGLVSESSSDNNGRILSRLTAILIEDLIDPETGDILAHAVPLSSDGGRPGYVLLSTNDVEPIPTSE